MTGGWRFGATIGAAVVALGWSPVVAAGQPSSGWSIQPSPNPRDASDSGLQAVACAKNQTCMAVGWYVNFLDPTRFTLAERWNGSRWSIEPTPNPKDALGSRLDGVSCPSPKECVAVGVSFLPDSTVGLAERWDGHRWSALPTPRPHGAIAVWFSAVSCAGVADCVAVGAFTPSDAAFQTRSRPLAEHWDGTAWRVETTPDPEAPDGSALDGVSCPTSALCEGVGNYAYEGMPFRDSVFALGRDGGTWTY